MYGLARCIVRPRKKENIGDARSFMNYSIKPAAIPSRPSITAELICKELAALVVLVTGAPVVVVALVALPMAFAW